MVGKNEKSGITRIGGRYRMTPGVQVGSVIKCADNGGANVLKIIAVKGPRTTLSRLPFASPGDILITSVKKGKPDMRKKVVPAVLIRQRKSWRRKEGLFISFEDNAAVVITPKGEPKGTAVSGPVAKECADHWSKIAAMASCVK
ncbi:large subunit ribosomal protein L23e [Nematocida homosporus]|uniref:large subunit ribosomal protein L23e n=1 Tax=Nematocida homosporus TaxID=1912981 RepID=UPI002220A8CD|nr:large subunit ribosomal protein L23e [Nematocida homosporus]KAI5184632.1 large subunit ribosomal protein L23e [Nematocida homosporus]